jgi:hypothetical protein
MVDESWEVSGRIMTRLGMLDGIKKNDLLVQLRSSIIQQLNNQHSQKIILKPNQIDKKSRIIN